MKSSYTVEFRQIPIQSEFQVFRGTESHEGHLARVEWLTLSHMSNEEQVKQDPKWGHVSPPMRMEIQTFG